VAIGLWQKLPGRIRRLLKRIDPTVVLEAEMKLIEFKASSLGDDVMEVGGASHTLAMIYEGLSCFHGVRYRDRASSVDGERRMFDVTLRKAVQEVAKEEPTLEVTCCDVVMAVQDLKPEPLTARSLRRYVQTQIHGTEDYS